MCKASNMQNISIDTLFELSEFFKFFGDTTRIRVIHLLLSGEMSVSAIAEKLNLEQSVVSHQLRILRTANLVKPTRDRDWPCSPGKVRGGKSWCARHRVLSRNAWACALLKCGELRPSSRASWKLLRPCC